VTECCDCSSCLTAVVNCAPAWMWVLVFIFYACCFGESDSLAAAGQSMEMPLEVHGTTSSQTSTTITSTTSATTTVPVARVRKPLVAKADPAQEAPNTQRAPESVAPKVTTTDKNSLSVEIPVDGQEYDEDEDWLKGLLK
jgi:hypothetical protein